MNDERNQDGEPEPEATSEEQVWPKAPLLSKDLVPAVNLVASLAVDIWLKNGGKDRPRDHLPEALELAQQAELLVQRPLSENEFLCQTGGGVEALTQVMLRRDAATPQKRIAFNRLIDPDGGRRSEIVEIRDGNGQRIQIDWSVYKGKEAGRSLKKLLLKFSKFRIQDWLTKNAPQLITWVAGGTTPPGLPDLTDARFGSQDKRAEAVDPWINGESIWPFPRYTSDHASKMQRNAFARPWITGKAVPRGFPPFTEDGLLALRIELADCWSGFRIDWRSPNALALLDTKQQSNWARVIARWEQEGIPEIDFIEFARYRTQLHSGAFASGRATTKGRRKTAKAD